MCSGGIQSQFHAGPNPNTNNGLGFRVNSPSATGGTSNVSGSNRPVAPGRSNSLKAASNSDSSAAGGNNGFSQRTSDMPQNLHLQDVVQDIARESADNGFFNSDLDDFPWKA